MAENRKSGEFEENGLNVVVIDSVDGREHEIVTDQDVFDKDTLMHPAYQSAFHALKGIVESTERWIRNGGDMYGFSNNVIAFCGSRGQGKTSVMMSFSAALGGKKRHMSQEELDRQRERLKRWTDGKKFHILPPIDPTMLADGSSVCDLILAKLFTEISEAWDDDSLQYSGRNRNDVLTNESKKYHILRLLQRCREGIRNKDKGDKDGQSGDFEQFVQSVDIFSFKKNLHEIIRYLLQIRHNDEKDDFIVIQLDDTDMQLEKAYETMEVVRQYLSIPNVVVLMAADLEQLRNLINVHYRRAIDNDVVSFRYDYMAAKYIDKLIPAAHAIHLPTMASSHELGKKLAFRADKDEPRIALEDHLFGEIYKKTGLVFISHRRRLHELLPSSLRGLQHLIRFVNRMDDPQAGTGEPPDGPYDARLRRTRQKLQNLSLFESYLLNDWFVSKVQAVYNETDTNKKYKIPSIRAGTVFAEDLVAFFYKWLSDEEPDNRSYEALVKRLFDATGDCRTSEDYNLFFFVGAYLSVQLNKYALADEIRSLEKLDRQRKIADPKEHEKRDRINVLDYGNLRSAILSPKTETPETLNDIFDGVEKGCDKKTVIGALVSLICFFDKAVEDTVRNRLKSEEGILDAQENLITIFFNWDILRQILKNLEGDWNHTGNYGKITKEFFAELMSSVLGESEVIKSSGLAQMDKTVGQLFAVDEQQAKSERTNVDESLETSSGEALESLKPLQKKIEDVLKPGFFNRYRTTRYANYEQLRLSIMETSSLSGKVMNDLIAAVDMASVALDKHDTELERATIELLKKDFNQYVTSLSHSSASINNDDTDK